MIFLLAVVTFIPSVYEFLFPEREDLVGDSAAIAKLSLIERKEKHSWADRKGETGAVKLFNFDPNHTTLAGWQKLGLSARQAAVMLRYVAKGGKFRQKEDLQKMYSINPSLYTRLTPFIHIAPVDSAGFGSKFKRYPKTLPRKPVMVSLNTADTLTLDEVKGIGPAFARRIVKYRERLGGFYKKEQLLEVFGLDSVKYREIKDQVNIDGSPLRKININKVEFADLQHNPYLSFKQVNAIIQFRKQHGNYSNIADLKKVVILPVETIEKLAPYISFDHD